IAGYKVLRSSAGGPFAEVAQVTETAYLDEGLPGGVDSCYIVRAFSAGNIDGEDSAVVCLHPGRHVAYVVPSGVTGTVTAGLPLGMDFDVHLGVRVTRLGVFDSGQDRLASGITARLVDRATETEVAARVVTPEDH